MHLTILDRLFLPAPHHQTNQSPPYKPDTLKARSRAASPAKVRASEFLGWMGCIHKTGPAIKQPLPTFPWCCRRLPSPDVAPAASRALAGPGERAYTAHYCSIWHLLLAVAWHCLDENPT